MDTRAIVYIASEQYIDEAARSARSISGHLSRFSHFIFQPLPDYNYWYLNSVSFISNIFVVPDLLHYDQFLLLDTDTFVCGDLEDFFTILDRFDIAGTQAVGRQTMVQRDDIPASFPELHLGAISFNRNQRVENLFKSWFEIYQSRPEYFGDNDQGPLREALWKDQDIKLGILPNEFCFRYRWGGLINGQVRILHGRENNTPYEKIAKQVNGTGIRVYQRRELA